MNAALMDFKKLAKFLKEWEHEMNLCDPCFWNKIAKGHQLTLLIHTDDALMTYELPQVVLSTQNCWIEEMVAMILWQLLVGRCMRILA